MPSSKNILSPDTPKRGRGRPRKNPLPNNSQTASSGQTPPKVTAISNVSWEKLWPAAVKGSRTISDHYSMNPNEQEAAFRIACTLPKGAVIVELGVTHGRTASLLSYAAKIKGYTYFGVDNFKLEGNVTQTQNNLKRLGLPFEIIVGNTNEVPWEKPIDYLLIDAGHDHLNMSQDCQRWLPFVKPGGLALFHDYNDKVDMSDPHFPVKHYASMYTQGWTVVEFIPYLMVKRKPL